MHRQKTWVERQNVIHLSYPLLFSIHTRLSNTSVLVDTCGRVIMTINIYFSCDSQCTRFDADKNIVLDKQLS